MSEPRLPAHLEVAGLIRRVQAEGGFATVLAKGERDAGTLLVIAYGGAGTSRAYERMPQPGGRRSWNVAMRQSIEQPEEFDAYCTRRREQDPDLWIVELDIANAERFIDGAPPDG